MKYFRLMRLNKPVGILLLWFPTVWALWIANKGIPPMHLVIYFLLGTVVMRSAGCVVNDLADRDIDRHVKRTRLRPVTTGEVSVAQALLLFFLLLIVALLIVIQLPIGCFYCALVGLLITIIYPFCKRWIQAPQLVLSLAFSVGIPMVYIASEVSINRDMWLLIGINILWVIAYDTIYAMVDREDDLKIGVKSSAILFGRYDRLIIGLLLSVMHCLWLLIAYSPLFLIGWGMGALILIHQNNLIARRNPRDCFKAFQWSIGYGIFMWMASVSINYY